ncbi:cellulose biosynthesis cyclic di-GMP-binding regulatory protein BcsB [Paenibacillus koleovorans]|uniref:cellulose biosynthesis cyclic di-GMP-binding regulatory protein BcsB n=1 Tax=Paenibacillus koleovorans TaxID=121608 RepID=UPI000FDA0856|nr:cellulose biosynthesis cyclic di-GMP-binding regulatory protein BcsB [Paenibacillus koleovorans]
MKRKALAAVLLASLLLVTQAGQLFAAELDPTKQQAYETPFTDTAASLFGILQAKQQFFQIADYWNVSDIKVNLDYKASPLLQNELSSVTLALNGSTFHSFRPMAKDTKQRLTVSIPVELLVKGTNTLSIESNMQTALRDEAVCRPTDNRESWLQLYDTSGVVVQYTTKPLAGGIGDFARHFVGLDTMNAAQNAVVVPANGQPAELEAAVYALSGFARSNPLKDKTIPLLTMGSDAAKEKKLLVAIALYDNLPADLKTGLARQNFQNEALLQLVNMTSQPTLVITSANPSLLVLAGRYAANQTLLGQLDAGTKVVIEGTDVSSPALQIGKTIPLTESGDKLTGAKHRTRSYFIPLPANRSVAEASKIGLDFRYAKNLDFNRSMVTVLINDAPIGSKKLNPNLADGDTLTLPIPQNLNITGNFPITVAFDLELANNTGCIQTQNEMPWAFITKDSLLQLNTKDRTDLLFNNYPYPFLRDGSYNQVAVVLPEERDANVYQSLTNLFNLLGQFVERNSGEVRFFGPNVAATELKNRNVMAVGTFRNNKLIRDNNEKLYFRFDVNGQTIRSNEKMSLDFDYGKRIGVLQLTESPYGEAHGLLTVTGVTPEHVALASKLVANQSTMWKVFGDGVITDKDGNIHAFRFKQEATTGPAIGFSEVLERTDVLKFMVALILVLVLVLVSLIFLIRKYRLKRREGR